MLQGVKSRGWKGVTTFLHVVREGPGAEYRVSHCVKEILKTGEG